MFFAFMFILCFFVLLYSFSLYYFILSLFVSLEFIISMDKPSEEQQNKSNAKNIKLLVFSDIEQKGKEEPKQHTPPQANDLITIMYTSGLFLFLFVCVCVLFVLFVFLLYSFLFVRLSHRHNWKPKRSYVNSQKRNDCFDRCPKFVDGRIFIKCGRQTFVLLTFGSFF
jgi:hypothetical protein